MTYVIYLKKYKGNADKKYPAVIFSNNKKIKTIHFGQDGASDYTIHKNPFRMREYVRRHGGIISNSIMNEDNSRIVHNKMNSITNSTKETWGKSGITTAGFWSRWLLWSEPTIKRAIENIEDKFNVTIKRKNPP
jgi:hypothetical protein